MGDVEFLTSVATVLLAALVGGLAARALRLPVAVRVHRGVDIPRMRQAGADAVIHAEFEAGMEMIRLGLDRLGFPDPEVDAYIKAVRQHRYGQEARKSQPPEREFRP